MGRLDGLKLLHRIDSWRMSEPVYPLGVIYYQDNYSLNGTFAEEPVAPTHQMSWGIGDTSRLPGFLHRTGGWYCRHHPSYSDTQGTGRLKMNPSTFLGPCQSRRTSRQTNLPRKREKGCVLRKCVTLLPAFYTRCKTEESRNHRNGNPWTRPYSPTLASYYRD